MQFHAKWPPFWDLSPNESNDPPPFCKKIVTDGPSISCISMSTRHFCMLVLPQKRGTVFPNNMEVSSLVINITTKGPDLKSSLRVSSQISSKHTYLLGNLPLNNRANFYLEVKIPDWCYNLYPQCNCKIAPKRLQLFPLLKYMFWPLLSNNYVIYI